MKKVLFVLLVFLLTAGLTVQSFGNPQEFENKEGLRKRVALVRIWELTRALNLDEETASRFFPVMHKYDKEKAEIRKSIRQDIIELGNAVDYHAEGQVRDILERLQKKRERIRQLEDKKISELRNILTLEQQARLVLFQRKFARDAKRILAEAKMHRAGMGRPEQLY